MHRGLTSNQQVMGDRYGRSAIGFPVNNSTSNGEYGGWFGPGLSHPTFTRAKSEAIWRTANGSTGAGPGASIQDIMQMLNQQGQQSPRPVIANVTRSGTNGLRLVGPRTNHSVSQTVPPPPYPLGSNGVVNPTSSLQASHGNQERNQHNGEHPGTTIHHLASDGLPKRWQVGVSAEIPTADHHLPTKANGVAHPPQQRGFNGNTPSAVAAAHQRLQGGARSQADQIRLLKSATTLGFTSEGSAIDASDEPNNRNLTSNFKTPASNVVVPTNRNIYNAGGGPVPLWRNRWTQDRQQQFRPGQSLARPGPMTTGAVVYRSDPAAHLTTSDGGGGGGTGAQGTAGQFSMENGRSASWQTTGAGEDVGNPVLANRLRQDRTQFHPDRVNSKHETVTAVDLMPATAVSPKHKPPPGLYANVAEENASKFARYGALGGSAFDRINPPPSYPPKLVPEGFRSDGSGIVPSSNGSIYSQLDHDNKVAKSHLIPEISDESLQSRSPGSGFVSSPRLQGTTTNCAQGPGFNAAPKRSILKKPKVFSTDYESGINAKRRTEFYPTRHSAGSVGYFNNGLSHTSQPAPISGGGVTGFPSQRQDSNQKRVTFKLDQ